MKTRAETGRKGEGRKRNAKNLKRAEIPSKINGLRATWKVYFSLCGMKQVVNSIEVILYFDHLHGYWNKIGLLYSRINLCCPPGL